MASLRDLRLTVGQPHDKAVVLPKFDALAGCSLSRFFDRTLIVGALDVFSAGKVPARAEIIDAIVRHCGTPG
jgi:hypothetical protein